MNGNSKSMVAALALMGMAISIVIGGCDKSNAVGPDVMATAKIISPANGSTVTGPNVLLKVATANFTFGAAAGKTSADQAAVIGGHIHVYQDRPIGLDADAVYQMTKYDTVTLGGFTPGVHYLIIQGAQSDHVDVETMVDSVMFTVTAP